ncbi:AraC family transcriptional regulator [Ruminiclostridium josui]|uniref:AraC family transcriptional regulator n=1 Tax=Ruminiclostridium josui TaxID=1499 RepID=UPI000463DE7F|nr:AraC family transcriptional regulator [Ruminiclostridium josui]
MTYYEISLETPLKYDLTGKFQAPSPEWMHFTRYMQNFELIVVTEGTAYLQIDEQFFNVCRGEFMLFPPLSKQSGYKSSSCAFYWLHFTYENSFQILSSDEIPLEFPIEKIYIPRYGKTTNLEKIIVLMKHLQDSVRSYHNSIQNNYLCTAVLCELFCQFKERNSPQNSSMKKRQLFNDIQDYIKWYRNTDIKVSEIAEYFGYNKRYLSEFFKSYSGYSLKQYIIKEKIDLAKYLLCETNDNISDIAYSLGFNDNHIFMKVFKKTVGLTPTQYRNANSKRLLFYK